MQGAPRQGDPPQLLLGPGVKLGGGVGAPVVHTTAGVKRARF